MADIFPPSLFGLIFLGFPLLIYSFVLTGRLLEAEYQSDKAAWEADGKPMNFLFTPAGHNWLQKLRGNLAYQRVIWVWLFKTPAWVGASGKSVRCLRNYRICVLLWNVWVLLVTAAVFLLWAAQG